MITIDGSQGEGGGAILRYALALSTLTGKPFRMIDIRKGRKDPGMKAQHLHCVKGLEELCGAKAKHAGIGGLGIEFLPGQIRHSRLSLDIGTAGSITLLLQSFMIPVIFSKKKVVLDITGGTDVPWSQPMDYFANVFLPMLTPYAKVRIEAMQRGFYPKGGGSLVLHVEGLYDFAKDRSVPPLSLAGQGKIIGIHGKAFATKALESQRVCERMRHVAQQALAAYNMKVDSDYVTSLSDGAGITLWTEHEHGEKKAYIGADCLGSRDLRAEEVGIRAAQSLLDEINSGAAIDRHLADQIISYMGIITMMTGKECAIRTSEITEHLKSNIAVTEQFLFVKFEIEGPKVVSKKI